MAKITLEDYRLKHRIETYEQLVENIEEDIKKGKIEPIISSNLNGKKPALYNSYRIIEEKKDYSEFIEELQFDLHRTIINSYYLEHLSVYEKERRYVKLFNEFLIQHEDDLKIKVSLNERSYEIFHEEKFLNSKGKTVLKHCGYTVEDLNVYHTTVPLAYFSNSKQAPQNILISENMDPFYSIRSLMIEGDDIILNEKISTVIYGAGKGIQKSFEDFEFCLEDYLTEESNTIYYWGDLDYEGIVMFENLSAKFGSDFEIKPFVPAYCLMLEKAQGIDLADSKINQTKNISGKFFEYFDDSFVTEIKSILENGKYIPQEILNRKDYVHR